MWNWMRYCNIAITKTGRDKPILVFQDEFQLHYSIALISTTNIKRMIFILYCVLHIFIFKIIVHILFYSNRIHFGVGDLLHDV